MNRRATSWNLAISQQEKKTRMMADLLRVRYPGIANAIVIKARALCDRATLKSAEEEEPNPNQRQNAEWLELLFTETNKLLGLLLRSES